jgi:hypothetical protein
VLGIVSEVVFVRQDFFYTLFGAQRSSDSEGGKKIKITFYFLTICSLSKMGQLKYLVRKKVKK